MKEALGVIVMVLAFVFAPLPVDALIGLHSTAYAQSTTKAGGSSAKKSTHKGKSQRKGHKTRKHPAPKKTGAK